MNASHEELNFVQHLSPIPSGHRNQPSGNSLHKHETFPPFWLWRRHLSSGKLPNPSNVYSTAFGLIEAQSIRGAPVLIRLVCPLALNHDLSLLRSCRFDLTGALSRGLRGPSECHHGRLFVYPKSLSSSVSPRIFVSTHRRL